MQLEKNIEKWKVINLFLEKTALKGAICFVKSKDKWLYGYAKRWGQFRFYDLQMKNQNSKN